MSQRSYITPASGGQYSATALAAGEVVADTVQQRIVVGDGVTVGGKGMAVQRPSNPVSILLSGYLHLLDGFNRGFGQGTPALFNAYVAQDPDGIHSYLVVDGITTGTVPSGAVYGIGLLQGQQIVSQSLSNETDGSFGKTGKYLLALRQPTSLSDRKIATSRLQPVHGLGAGMASGIADPAYTATSLFTGSVSGSNVLTVTTVAYGPITAGSFGGFAAGGTITGQLSGTTGGIGTYSTSGIGATTSRAFAQNGNYARTSPWMWAIQIKVWYNEWKRLTLGGNTAGAALYSARILGSWLDLQSVYTSAEMVATVYGLNATCGLSDDACWFATALACGHEATGSASMLNTLIEYIPATNVIFRDPGTNTPTDNPLIDYGVSTPGYNGSAPIAFKSNQRGFLYTWSGDTGGIPLYGYTSTCCELFMAAAALYASQQSATPTALAAAFRQYAINVQSFWFANCRTPAPTAVGQSGQGGYFEAYNLDKNVGTPAGLQQPYNPNEVYLRPQAAYFGQDIRGLAAVSDKGTLMMGNLCARLFQVTGQAQYLAEFRSIAAAYPQLNLFGRLSPPLPANGVDDGLPRVPVIGNLRDPWGNGQAHFEFTYWLTQLTAPTEFPLFRSSIVNTAKHIIAGSRDGYITPEWGGLEFNFLTKNSTWEQESASNYGGGDGGGQSRGEQAPTQCNSLFVVQAATLLTSHEANYGSGLSNDVSIETLAAQVASLLTARDVGETTKRWGPNLYTRPDNQNGYLVDYFGPNQMMYRGWVNGQGTAGVYGAWACTDLYVNGVVKTRLAFKDPTRYIDLNGDGDVYLNGAAGLTLTGAAHGIPIPGWNFGINNVVASYITALGFRTYGAVRAGSMYTFDVDNAYSFGEPGARATVVYATTATINTSDATEKTLRPADGGSGLGAHTMGTASADGMLTTAELAAAKDIASLTRCYMWDHAIDEKGVDHARWHYGPMAQDVATALQNHGLIDTGALPTTFRHAFLCWDSWEADPGTPAIEADPENGVPARPADPPREAGSRYGLRHTELQYFILAAQEQRLLALEAA